MTTRETPSWNDLDEVDDPSTDDEELPTIKLDPGERLMGDLVAIEQEVGEFDNTLLTIASESEGLVKFWSNGTIDRRLDRADAGPGDYIGLKKSDDAETYTDDDGEEVEYHPYEVRILGDG